MIVTAYTLRVGQTVRPSGETGTPFRTVSAMDPLPGRIRKYRVTFTDGSQRVVGRHLVWEVY